MTKAEILKKEILRQYRSVRQFAMEMNIPYSTLVTALERGIEGIVRNSDQNVRQAELESCGFFLSGERCISGGTAFGKSCYAELCEAESDGT